MYPRDEQKPVNDHESLDPEPKSDKERAAPDLKTNTYYAPPVATGNRIVTREMPRFAEDSFYQFGKPNSLGKPGLSDFWPDSIAKDGTDPRKAIPDEVNDQHGLFRWKT